MKDVSVRNKGNKLSLRSKILLGALALAVIAVLGTVVRAAQDEVLFNQVSFFNPFTLRTIVSVAQSDSGTIILDEPIRISGRPPLRSAARPEWVPPRGKPPWLL